MKKIALLLAFAMLLILACTKTDAPAPAAADTKAAETESAKNDALKNIRAQIKEARYEEALSAIESAAASYGMDDLYGLKAYALQMSGKNEEALALIDESLNAGKGERARLMSSRHDILLALGRLEEALSVIQKIDEEREKKSPWTALTIAEDQLKLERIDDALRSLELAVERGLISKSALTEQEAFKALMEHEGFKSLLTKMDEKIGLGSPAKPFALKDLSGQDLSLELLKGKVVLVDFWATWCPPCREEIPNLKAYYSEFRDRGFEIVGISLDREREALDQYIQENEIAWRISYSGKYWQDETAAQYGVNSIPSTWLVDRKGLLRHFDLRGEELKKAIVALLGEE